MPSVDPGTLGGVTVAAGTDGQEGALADKIMESRVRGADGCGFRGYAGGMRYAQGGGLTAEGRRRREQVRLAAVERFEQRVPAAEIAAELRVTERSVRRWRQAWLAGGLAGLASKGPAARCLLDEQQLAGLESVLEAGPLAAGSGDQRWTLARVRDLVARRFGVRVHHPRGLVPAAPPRLVVPDGRAPGHRARRRRHRGVEEGDLAPGKRTAAALGGWIVFEDESGQSLRPPRSRTWARRGSPRSSASAAAAPGTSPSPGWPATGPAGAAA